MFFLFNSPLNLRAASADCHETSPHYLGTLYNECPKIRVLSPKKIGAKNMQNWARFYTASDCNREYLLNKIAYPKLERWSRTIPPAFGKKVWWTVVHEESRICEWTHPNPLFRKTIFRPLEAAGPWNFYTR